MQERGCRPREGALTQDGARTWLLRLKAALKPMNSFMEQVVAQKYQNLKEQGLTPASQNTRSGSPSLRSGLRFWRRGRVGLKAKTQAVWDLCSGDINAKVGTPAAV